MNGARTESGGDEEVFTTALLPVTNDNNSRVSVADVLTAQMKGVP